MTHANASQSHTAIADKILDSAVKLAESSSWESVRLQHIVQDLGITLDEIQQYYRQKDDLVEAWYDRADRAMLISAAKPGYRALTPHDRLHQSIMAWLDAMAEHRRVSREMLYYKLEPGHIHLQALGVMRISRTVQWILESAYSETKNLQRIFEEITVTGIYLATFSHWMFDHSVNTQETRKFLHGLLYRAECVSQWIQPVTGVNRNGSSASPQATKAHGGENMRG
ncbi:MAG: TetR/AcrR family transcriptional regulator [Candidatus Thiodiazotropha sp. (ex Dulcina madagascariensis)]|nr:TetR/AcrR family transcriptional regulator [Candidatus Thiodiazotropha sp. (ex Dulcina madagascariensis)]